MSTVKVNTVDKRTGGTLTLGGCGTTVTLGAGATQSGFGRTGTVDWCTTAKTAPFTGVSGKGYFVNTTCGAVTVTLPASPSAGDIISVADYASTFQTNNVTLCNNSSKINGVCGSATLSTEGQSITLVYVDGTRGWKNTMDSTSDVSGTPNFIVATGGTITCCGDYKIHTFTADGCFSVSNAGTPAGSTTVDYLVVAGGGAGGNNGGGGGGGGGFRMSNSTSMPAPTTSPLASPTGLPVSATTYPITVGSGGAGIPNISTPRTGGDGSNSVFSTITSTAGGGGGGNCTCLGNIGRNGGSGGGAAVINPPSPSNGPGTGNTPPVSPPQGNNGGTGHSPYGPPYGGGGGGGAGQAGNPAPASGDGGDGSYVSPSFAVGGAGTTGPVCGVRYFAGGGGSGIDTPGAAGSGGAGGGGAGSASPPGLAATSGTANTGGGGGGGGGTPASTGSGGSGIVIIRYKYQ
jgi:hypothetical protein